MEGGEMKEEASLPPDYVSLAQLQERWLQKKQEEIKRKEKEEEERREREARVLREKQEEDERREREVRAQNERNRNRNWNGNWNRNRNQNEREGAKMGVIEEKGKGKEVVLGGPGNGGWNKKRKGGRRKNGKNFKGAEAGEGGSGGGGLSGVEEVGYVCVVEVLPRNGEIGDVKRSDLRGEFKINGRNKGSAIVNELKQSEVAIELEKKEEEGEKDCGKKWSGSVSGSGRWSEEGGERGAERGGVKGDHRKGGRNGGNPERRKKVLKEYGPVVREGHGVDLKLKGKSKTEDEISEVRSERTSLRAGDRNEARGRDSKAKEDGAEGHGSNGLGRKVDHKALARRGGKGGYGTGYRAIGIRGRDNEAKEEGVEGEGSNSEIVEVELEKKVHHKVAPRKGENRDFERAYRANGIRGQDNGAKEEGVEGEGSNGAVVEVELEKKVDHNVLPRRGENRGSRRNRVNRFQGRDNKVTENGVEGEGSNGEIVEVELEKKVDHMVSPRKDEDRVFGRADRRANGIWGRNNKAREEGVEGEGSNGEIAEVELDGKVDHRVLPRKSDNRGVWRNRGNGIQGRDNKATEEGVRGEGSNGEIVEVELDKKVAHKVLPREGESRGFERNRANGIHGRDNKAMDDGVERESSNGDKVAVEIVKTVYPEVLPRNGQNGSFRRGYLANGNRGRGFERGYLANASRGGGFERGYLANGSRGRGFERGGRHTRPEISDDCKMQWRAKPVWVKKEEKLDA